MDYAALAKQFGGQSVADESATDYAALASQFGGEAEKKKTTARGMLGAVTRGASPILAGAVAGGALGAPTGVGIVPGAVAGAGAMALTQFVGDPVVGLVNSALGTKYSKPTDAMMDFLSRIGVSNPETEAERIVQASAAGAAGAGGMASAAKAIQSIATNPVTQKVAGQLASNAGAQIGGGMGAGAAGQAAQEGGADAATQIAASLAGGVAGARAMNPAVAVPRNMQGVRQTIEEAEKMGVPVMTSDVMPPKTFIGRVAQNLGERIPIAGTGALRADQQTKRIEAIRDTLKTYGADDVADLSDDIMKSLVSKRTGDFAKYANAKGEVINRLSKGEVPVTNAVKAIDDQINELSKRATEGADEAIEALAKIKSDVQGRNLFQLEAYRKDELSKIFANDPARPMSIAARDAGEKALRAIYKPVNDDMGAFIKQTGQRRDFDQWMVANRRLSELSGDLDKAALKSVLRSGQATPEDINRLLLSKKPSDLKALYQALPDAGKVKARSAILGDAAKKAEYTAEDGTRMFSPEKFNTALDKLSPQIEIFFKGDQTIDGLARVLNMSRRAGEAGVVTKTGQEAMPYVAGASLTSLFGLGGGLVAAGGAGLLARAYESPAMRNMLINIAKTKQGTPEEATLVKRLISTMQAESQREQP